MLFIEKFDEFMGVKTNIIKNIRMGQQISVYPIVSRPVVNGSPVSKNKKIKKEKNMTKEQMDKAMMMADELNPQTKVLKKDRGLIERVESSKVILTEDNRQLLND